MRYKTYTFIFFLIIIALVANACASSGGDAKEQHASPSTDDLDPDDPKTEEIERGEEIMVNTNTELEDNVGNELSCMSCHANTNLNGPIPLAGTNEKYPQYRSRDDAVASTADRINGCMERSMNGEKLPEDSEDLQAMESYLEFISEPYEGEDPDDMSWLESADMEEVPEPDVDRGKALYESENCMTCHAEDGSGSGTHSGPPLWGEDSFNDGAGMGRLSKNAGFIQKNMPLNEPGTLTDQEAADLAAYLLSHERPEWSNHAVDWPKGGAPDDTITKERREQIRNGTFDWTQLEDVKQ